jgi:FecR protein
MKLKRQGYGAMAGVCVTLFACVARCDRAGAESKQAVATLVATVQTLNGALEVQRIGLRESQAIQERASLYGGDVTNTGANSKATLLLNEGSRLDVNTGTIVELTTPVQVGGNRPSYFRLLKGEVFLRARSSLAVQTRSATAAVHGTSLDLTTDAQGVSTLTVHEGSVDFFNPYGTVVVGVGQQSTVRPGFAPTTPVPIAAYSDTSWTQDLDRALAAGTGISALLKPLATKKTFWQKTWVKIFMPAVLIGVVAAVVDNNNNSHDRGRGGTDQSPGF